MDNAYYKIEVYLPPSHLDAVRDAMHAAGAGASDRYDRVCSWYSVNGSWRPLDGSTPYDGAVGRQSVGSELKLEMRCAAPLAVAVVAAARAAHPYEEAVINVIPLVQL